MKQVGSRAVPINIGNLLENALEKWKGGSHHVRGAGEYISNSDDSYRRLDKFIGQEIFITIKSRTGKRIEELIIEDFGEGMSYEDLTDKFFQYFESAAGREKGFKVTGRFGTGGKAYAIMNFRRCWIVSVKNGLECRAWFKWDADRKEILHGYDGLGYINEKVKKPNGTKIILEDSYKVNHTLDEFVSMLERSTRIRHVLKNQIVKFRIERKGETKELQLTYSSPDKESALRKWEFDLPDGLKNSSEDSKLILRYFEQHLGENSFIDLSDGISSVADLDVSKFDGRPFSRNINGEMTLTILEKSQAVKEDRKGLEEYDDLTLEIEEFVREKVKEIINEIEKISRDRDKEARINAASEKLNALSKFLSKQDLKFKLELKELQKRFANIDIPNETESEIEDESLPLYRKPVDDDLKENLIRGRWIEKEEFEGTTDVGVITPKPTLIPEFIEDEKGDEFAVKVGSKKKNKGGEKKTKKGIDVLMSNNSEIQDCPYFNAYHDPVSDRELVSKGIIWINSVHPIIAKAMDGDGKILHEHIANFVLMIVAQYHAQKEMELLPEEERDALLIFRKNYFELQKSIREDKEAQYFVD